MGSLYKRGRIWWLKYYQNGRTIRESSETSKETVARRMLRAREGDVERGVPITPRVGRVLFAEAAADVLTDYRVNRRRTTIDAERRLKQHVLPVFGQRRLAGITTADVQRFVEARQQAGAANGEINRELALIKRAFTLAIRAGTLHHRPHVALLREDNVRQGFFEREQFEAVRDALPEALRPVVTFAYCTGWRVASEILPLQWRHVDFTGGEVRLDPGTTKNREGRTFPFTADLRHLLEDQRAEAERLRAAGRIVPWVFHRDGEPIRDFRGAWQKACRAAGCPGRLLHDFRRTAVRNLERVGVPRSAAMAMVGHKTESVYRRYAIVDGASLREAAAKIDAMGTIPGTIRPASQPLASGGSR